MTIHTSKGLEFSHVFLCGMSEGILPSFRSMRERKIRALEEERRLTYVAITRAMNGLYLTESEGFNYNSGDKYPSRFIFEIKKNFITQVGELNSELIEHSRNYIKRIDHLIEKNENSFKLKDFVWHPIFGKGQIITIDSDKQEYQIKFEEREIIRSISMDFQLLRPYKSKGEKKSSNINEKYSGTIIPHVNKEIATNSSQIAEQSTVVSKEKKKKRGINWFWFGRKNN
jgi:DNA helicase-2/ATP-dependent DNA helicase PcrA